MKKRTTAEQAVEMAVALETAPAAEAAKMAVRFGDTTTTALTTASQALFTDIVKDLGNWGGCTPTYNHLDTHSRGNLTDLKRRGLVTTWDCERFTWIELTPAGRTLATELGLGEYL